MKPYSDLNGKVLDNCHKNSKSQKKKRRVLKKAARRALKNQDDTFVQQFQARLHKTAISKQKANDKFIRQIFGAASYENR